MSKIISDLDNIYRVRWHIMPKIVGMDKFKLRLDGSNVLDVLIDQPMI